MNAFNSLWVANCGDGTLVRAEPRTVKVTKTLTSGAGTARAGIAATADSVWMFTDARGTISRIDPVQNVVVAEFRVYPDCNTLTFGETALWLTCPAENSVLRIDPATNLVDKSIEVSDGPVGAGDRRNLGLGAVREGRQGGPHRPEDQQSDQDHRTGRAGRPGRDGVRRGRRCGSA